MFVISLEKLVDVRLKLWSHDILGVISSESSVPQVLMDMTLTQFPRFAIYVNKEKFLSSLTDAFLNRKDKNCFKYEVDFGDQFEGTFYVDLVQVYE